MNVDFRHKVSMPIRDMHRDGKIVFWVDVYGWTAREVATIPGGSAPFFKAVERMGLSTDRYRAEIWDAPV
jgi:hypothetical protein